MPKPCPNSVTFSGALGEITCGCIVDGKYGSLGKHQLSFWCPNGGIPEKNNRHAFQFVKKYLAHMEALGIAHDEGVIEVCVMFLLWLLPTGDERALPSFLRVDWPTWVNQIKAKASELGVPSSPPLSLRSLFSHLEVNAKVGNNGRRKELLSDVCDARLCPRALLVLTPLARPCAHRWRSTGSSRSCACSICPIARRSS